MSRERPANIPPGSWLFAGANSVMPGRSAILAPAGAFSNPPGGYGPQLINREWVPTSTTLVKVDAGDSGDGLVIGVTAQLGITKADINIANTDVMLKAEWGNAGSPNFALMKLGNGVTFSVPVNFFRLTAQNLADQCQVIATAAPYPLRANPFSSPRYSFTISVDPAFNPLQGLRVFRLYDFFADKANFAVVPASMRNNSPAPEYIPPYANSVSLYITGLGAGVNLALTVVGATGTFLRSIPITTDANGNAVLLDLELPAETAFIRLSPANLLANGQITYDFALAL